MRGPDGLLIEMVEDKPIPEGIFFEGGTRAIELDPSGPEYQY